MALHIEASAGTQRNISSLYMRFPRHIVARPKRRTIIEALRFSRGFRCDAAPRAIHYIYQTEWTDARAKGKASHPDVSEAHSCYYFGCSCLFRLWVAEKQFMRAGCRQFRYCAITAEETLGKRDLSWKF